MIRALKRFFGMGSDFRSGIKIVVNKEKLETRVALVENGSLEEYTIERSDSDNVVGSIFKGKVRNLEPGLKAMFVDIGFEKNAFLHYWDAIPAALDEEMETIERSGKPARKPKITSKDIPSIYPVGSEVMVQVTKGPIGNKGPRVTTNVSLAGRYMVLMPRNDQFGISRKIEDPKERMRLRRIMEKLSVPESMGIILRTAAQGMRARFFVRDLAMLVEQWEQIEHNNQTMAAPARVFNEPDLVERTVRDFLTEEVDEVLCDDQATTERMRTLAGQISRRSKRRFRLVTSQQSIFDQFGIQKQIDNAFFRQVWLPCGGYIVIDETEAMISIDVNTGRNKGSKDMDRTILETNIESAREVARQVRLRNIGGLIVIDFIDMKARARPEGGLQGDAGWLETRQGQNPGFADLTFRVDGDDAPAAPREPEHIDFRPLPLLPWAWADQVAHQHECRVATDAAQPASDTSRKPTGRADHRASRGDAAVAQGGRQPLARNRAKAPLPPYLPGRCHVPSGTGGHRRCRERHGVGQKPGSSSMTPRGCRARASVSRSEHGLPRPFRK